MGISVIGSVVALAKGRLKSLDKEMLLISSLLFGGSALFFLALARQLIAHEYYFIDSLYPAIILLLIPGLGFVGSMSRSGKLIWLLIFGSLLIGGSFDSKAVQDEKYAQTEWDRGEVTRKNFTDADVFLDGLGIPRDAKILVFEAYSTNAPLLLMGRRGYTILNSREENIKRALELDFDYIVVQDVYFPSDLMYSAPWLSYSLRRIGGNGRISVFTYHIGWIPSLALPIHVQGRFHQLLSLNDRQYEQRIVMSPEMADDLLYGSIRVDTFPKVAFSENIDIDIVHKVANKITKSVEFGSAMIVSINDLNGADRLLVDVSFDGVLSLDMVNADFEFDIVMSVERSTGQKQCYKSYRVKRSKPSDVYGYTCVFDIPRFKESDLTLKCYVWNRFSEDLDISAIRFTAYRTSASFN